MKEVTAQPPKAPQTSAQVLAPDPAKVPTVISNPTGTLSITLTAPPPPTVPLHQNVALWVALITLLGVALSLIAAERRTKKELQASEARMRTELMAAADSASIEREQTREQAALDRQHSSERAHQERITIVRRAVYLELIDELTKAQEFMASLVRRDSLNNLDPSAALNGLTAAITKMNLIGQMDTVLTSRKFLVLIHRTLAKALPLSLQIQMQSRALEQHRKMYDAAQADVKELLSELTKHNETCKDDIAGLKALEAAFRDSKVKAEHHESDAAAASVAVFVKQQEYASMMMEENVLINAKFDDLIHAIRTELGLETSIERLRDSTAEIQSIMVETSAELISTLPVLAGRVETQAA